MGMVIKGTKPDNSRADLQLDTDGNLLVSTVGTIPDLAAEKFLAGANSATGRIGTLALSGVMYVRLDTNDANYDRAEWLVSSDKQHAVQPYKSRSVVDSVTVTLGTADLDNGDDAYVNGKKFSAHTDTTVCATGQYAIDGNTAADVIELAKVLKPGTAVTLATAVADDTVTINDETFTCTTAANAPATGGFIDTSDALAAAGLVLCINHKDNVTCATVSVADKVYIECNGKSHTYTAAGTAVVASGVFSQAGNNTADGDSLVLCVNHKDTITLATAVAGDSVTVNGLTYTGKASTAVYPTRQFSIDTDDTAAAVSLAAVINHATYGVPGVTATSALGVVTLTPDTFTQAIAMTAGVGGTNTLERVVCVEANGVRGVTAVNAAGVVSLTRDYEAADITLTSSNSTRLACVAANGVPGVLAAVSDGGEVYIVPTWKGETITVTSSSDTIKYADYGLPGCSVAYTATTVVITPDMDSAAPCTCIYAVIDDAAAEEFTVTNGTLANLEKDGAATATIALNSTSLGQTYSQDVDGYPYLYLGFTSEDAGAVSVPVVKATLFTQ